ncbi:hypothetical protein CsatA_014125 [Cannabis sativa]
MVHFVGFMAGIFLLVASIILMMMQLNTVHAVDFKSPPPPPRAPPAPEMRRAPTLHF